MYCQELRARGKVGVKAVEELLYLRGQLKRERLPLGVRFRLELTPKARACATLI